MEWGEGRRDGLKALPHPWTEARFGGGGAGCRGQAGSWPASQPHCPESRLCTSASSSQTRAAGPTLLYCHCQGHIFMGLLGSASIVRRV